MCESEQFAVWTLALNLPGYEVLHYAEDEIDGVRRFSVVPMQIINVCPECGRACDCFRQKRWIKNVLDLPLGGRPVRLKVRVFQYSCQHCGKIWTPPSPILAEGTWATERLVERAATLVRHGDVANASVFFGIPEKTLERWYYDYVERQQRQQTANSKPIRALGIDELSLKKNTASLSR